MKDKLTKKEICKLKRIFSDEDVEFIVNSFSVADIKKVINHSYWDN